MLSYQFHVLYEYSAHTHSAVWGKLLECNTLLRNYFVVFPFCLFRSLSGLSCIFSLTAFTPVIMYLDCSTMCLCVYVLLIQHIFVRCIFCSYFIFGSSACLFIEFDDFFSSVVIVFVVRFRRLYRCRCCSCCAVYCRRRHHRCCFIFKHSIFSSLFSLHHVMNSVFTREFSLNRSCRSWPW